MRNRIATTTKRGRASANAARKLGDLQLTTNPTNDPVGLVQSIQVLMLKHKY